MGGTPLCRLISLKPEGACRYGLSYRIGIYLCTYGEKMKYVAPGLCPFRLYEPYSWRIGWHPVRGGIGHKEQRRAGCWLVDNALNKSTAIYVIVTYVYNILLHEFYFCVTNVQIWGQEMLVNYIGKMCLILQFCKFHFRQHYFSISLGNPILSLHFPFL